MERWTLGEVGQLWKKEGNYPELGGKGVDFDTVNLESQLSILNCSANCNNYH